jgi:hypothetical protein
MKTLIPILGVFLATAFGQRLLNPGGKSTRGIQQSHQASHQDNILTAPTRKACSTLINQESVL